MPKNTEADAARELDPGRAHALIAFQEDHFAAAPTDERWFETVRPRLIAVAEADLARGI
jgi:hypothetical protein